MVFSGCLVGQPVAVAVELRQSARVSGIFASSGELRECNCRVQSNRNKTRGGSVPFLFVLAVLNASCWLTVRFRTFEFQSQTVNACSELRDPCCA
jgi:hypothetical protein